jgi:hypothetical protein
MAKRLVIDLVGRICMVTKRNDLWAVFLNIPENPKRNLREHRPLLGVPLSMVKSQNEADAALLTAATFVKRLKATRRSVDQLGIFQLGGQDLTIRGAAAGTGPVRIADAADLNKIVASVDPTATFEPRILGPRPSRFGISARLRLPSSATVTAITEDRTIKTFWPGGHRQRLASYVRCEIPFANDLRPPVLRSRAFKGGRPFDYRFDATRYDELTLTMSNLCNCAGETGYNKEGMVEDAEFSVYYQLVRKPGLREQPLPTIPNERGARYFICFMGARLDLILSKVLRKRSRTH